MKKIGRNEPCPCKSGKKYKNCCLHQKEEQELPLIIQPHQEILQKYFSITDLDLQSERNKLEREIISTIDITKDSIELLVDYLNVCEKTIECIASKHRIYDLIFWSRRLAPKNIFNVADSSVMLYKEIQTLSIYKYGNPEEELYSDEKVGVIPLNLEKYYTCSPVQLYEKLLNEDLSPSIINIISDVIRIEILCYLYLDATQYYRVANKGGKVFIEKYRLNFKISEELDYLINLYDKRLTKSNLFSSVGAYFNSEFDKTNDKIFCPSIQLNVDHKQNYPFLNLDNSAYREFISADKKLEVVSNYLLAGINLKEVYNFLKLFSKEFQVEYTYSVEEFVVFLGFVGMNMMSNIYQNPMFQLNILNRAYSLRDHKIDTVAKEFKEDFKFIYKTIFEKDISDSEFDKIDPLKVVASVTLDLSKSKDLDLWTRGPKKIFHSISKDKLLVDFTALNDIVAYVAKNIARIDGEVGGLRGGYFEDLIISEVKKHFKIGDIWIYKRIIEAKLKSKEIDATLIIEDVLFVIEAKAINLSFGFDKGDKQALEFRIRKMKKAIKESNEKAVFISKYHRHLNINLPSQIKFICPIVLSSFPEYIWEKSDELFISISNSLPRIITINDIKELKNIDLKKLKMKDWVLELE